MLFTVVWHGARTFPRCFSGILQEYWPWSLAPPETCKNTSKATLNAVKPRNHSHFQAHPDKPTMPPAGGVFSTEIGSSNRFGVPTPLWTGLKSWPNRCVGVETGGHCGLGSGSLGAGHPLQGSPALDWVRVLVPKGAEEMKAAIDVLMFSVATRLCSYGHPMASCVWGALRLNADSGDLKV